MSNLLLCYHGYRLFMALTPARDQCKLRMKVTNTLTESITMNLEGGMRHKRDINNNELKNVMVGEVDFVHFAFRL